MGPRQYFAVAPGAHPKADAPGAHPEKRPVGGFLSRPNAGASASPPSFISPLPALKEAGKATPKPLNKQLEAPPSLPPLQQRAKIPSESLLAINRGISVAGTPFKITPDVLKPPPKQPPTPAEPPKTQPKSSIPRCEAMHRG